LTIHQHNYIVVLMVPQFDINGNLPAGVHEITVEEFIRRFGSNNYRRNVISGLLLALSSLKKAGCKRVYIDGSFITEKIFPGDYDGCWDVDNVDPLLLDPVLLNFDYGRAAQKMKYSGEFFPAQLIEGSSGITFFEFFQQDKDTGAPKGIVAINLQELQT
jgi:hypothetical protein